MILNEAYTLSNGIKIPKIGLGTWMLSDKEAESAVKEAISLGYRHIDTAKAYGNEEGVGKGVRESGISREEIFVTSKVLAECKTYESAKEAIELSLKKLDLDYIDLMIIHSPQPWAEFRGEKRYFEENKEVWRALEDAYKAKKVRAIGVSNFLRDDLESLLESCEIKPMVNQILAHISNTPKDLIEFCKEQGILTEAYSPVAHGEILKNKAVAEMAEKYRVSVPALCVRYVLQLNMVALPKTGNPSHMKENVSVDFVISKADMGTLSSMDKIKDYGEYSFFPVFAGK